MKTYFFLTKDSFRCEVKASSPKAGYNKLMAIPHLKESITKSFGEYDKDGLCAIDNIRTLEQ
jgi:hypothetical protein